jgi:glycosyltransferase involved in cell wall biosynthesis
MGEISKFFITWWPWILFSLFCLVTFIQLIYYITFFRRVAFHKAVPKVKSQTYAVSIIVCARDEANNLTKYLPGVLVQTYPSTHELIVVNHNSQDETRYLLDEFKKTFKNLQAINLEQEALGIPGKKYPLSIGIKEAKHEILLLTDADCVPASEFWLQKMQDAYEDGIEIVLGYGAYTKKPGILNKLIRFETFHSALQYMSFALAGLPYMGVGRNLSYKRELFFRTKGFSSINHVASGDDDLFINQVATKHNVNVVLDPEAFTLSEPKRRFKDWIRQKNRHYSTGKFYKPVHKFLLGLYSTSHFLLYPLFVLCLLFFDWRITLGVFGLRFIWQAVIYYNAMKKMNEKDLFFWWWLLDIWMFIHYFIFAPSIWRKPNKNWH